MVLQRRVSRLCCVSVSLARIIGSISVAFVESVL